MMNIYKTREEATLPSYATKGSAAFDVSACFGLGEKIKSYNPWNKQINIITKTIGGVTAFQIHPESRVLVPTGLIFDIPEKYVMKMYVRSSVAVKKGLTLTNGVGIIDSDYVEESYILLHNVSDSLVTIANGERLAQCILEPVKQHKLVEISEAPAQKTDRDGGIGSTGA
tara:strand:- start:900 stop:1409 length:510 start_codon:yes stop_codon:yes gene_type:complete